MGRGRFHLTFFPSPALAPTLTRHADDIATEPTSLMLWDELVLRAFFDEQRARGAFARVPKLLCSSCHPRAHFIFAICMYTHSGARAHGRPRYDTAE